MLKNFQFTPHPAKAILTQFEVPMGIVSRFIGLSYSYTSNILLGNNKATEKVDRKLNELIDLVRKERAGNA